MCSKEQTWKIYGDKCVWDNYPTKEKCDNNGRLFILENEDIMKNQFIKCSWNKNGNKLATIDNRGNI